MKWKILAAAVSASVFAQQSAYATFDGSILDCTAYASGDFDGDNKTDYVCGVGFADTAGVVYVKYGKEDLTVQLAQGEGNDRYGFSLATGDFNQDGYMDLAVGMPNYDVYGKTDAGAVSVHLGASSGLKANKNIISQDGLHQMSPDGWYKIPDRMEGEPEAGDHFGYAVASGDFNLDGYADLAVGVPDESVGDKAKAGAVNVFYGWNDGLTDFLDKNYDGISDNYKDMNIIYQDKGNIEGVSEAGDRFGAALTTLNSGANSSIKNVLAIGVPNEDIGSVRDAGAVLTIAGKQLTGFSSTDSGFGTHQGMNSIAGAPEEWDRYGEVLTAGDYNGDGYDDLAVGVPGEGIGSKSNAGMVVIQPGSMWNTGYGASSVAIYKDTMGLTSIASEWFGRSLATGDVNGDGFDDLVVGDSRDTQIEKFSRQQGFFWEEGEKGGVWVLAGQSNLDSSPSYNVGLLIPFADTACAHSLHVTDDRILVACEYGGAGGTKTIYTSDIYLN